MRLKRAVEFLRQASGNIAEIAFKVGFQDPSYFSKSFQKQFGKTPSEFIIACKQEPKTFISENRDLHPDS